MTLDRRSLFVRSASAAVAAAAALPDLDLQATTPAPPKVVPVKTGGSRMVPIMGGKHQVWTKQVGSGATKVLTLHGGPGFGHEYLECFEDFLPQAGIRYWYYDQLGCSYSDNPDDDSLWTLPRFTDEVDEVRAGLGLEKMILYGHSWGSMLAMEYALKYPQRLQALVLSDMTASIPSYMKYVAELRSKFPEDVRAILDKYEARGDYEAEEYTKTVFGVLYTQHICRLDPWPEPVMRSLKHFNTKVYNALQGPNEFVITGRFKDWDRWKDLPKIKVPTLVIGGRYDTMNPEDHKRIASLIPGAKLHICENGSHLCMYDDQQSYMKALIGFLKGVGGPTRT